MAAAASAALRSAAVAAVAVLLPAPLRVRKRALQAWLWGEAELRLLGRLCDPRALSLDVGANNGVYTYHLLRHSAGVVAFEPQPALADFLDRALDERVRVERVALSAADGLAMLRVPRARASTGMATVEAANRLVGQPSATLPVTKRRLDGYAFPRLGFVKIDVEGHELAVLEGGRGLLRRDRPNLLVEAEDRHRPGAVASVVGWLAREGYRAQFLEGGQLRPIVALGARGADGLGRAAAERGIGNFVFVHGSGTA
jgi:FkbM family methyltransferase